MLTTRQALTIRWERVVMARIQETEALMEKLEPKEYIAATQILNKDRFWENILDDLEKQIRAVDADHPYLPENK